MASVLGSTPGEHIHDSRRVWNCSYPYLVDSPSNVYLLISLRILTYLSCFTPVSAMNEKTYDMHSADNTRWY